ncbi:hypothetical protein MATL_G00226200 [Megalops atlanticus]|uniref:GB1/RHD3-type G domain-containing protein n=1 Tax=Megalops atlanticus TaxID=7932 RepID=A0A9D3PFA3_MEGAT|nr:hypothetical protein MATL_G00226200 [Megalops atlanticus]
MWCVPHPYKHDHTLVLLDTEGLGDVEKGDEEYDAWIFVLTILLSSTLIYNSMGTIDNDAVMKLQFMTELTKFIKVRSSTEDEDKSSSEFAHFFPSFVWTVRDLTLKLQMNEKEISPDEYLENALQPKEGESKQTAAYNAPRECIRQYFPQRKCFVFDQPASKEKLQTLEQMSNDDLDVTFVRQTTEFISFILRRTRKKVVDGKMAVTGNMLANLVVTYVEAIRNGQVPCLQNAVLALSHFTNSTGVQQSHALYRQLLEERVKLPTETEEELFRVHEGCQKEAVQRFMACSFKDDDQHYQNELIKHINDDYEKKCQENAECSQKHCTDVLKQMLSCLDTDSFKRRGGYKDYMIQLDTIIQKYKDSPGKGIKAEHVLEAFMEQNKIIQGHIQQEDIRLTEKEKEIKVKESYAHYKQLIEERVVLPTDTQEELHSIHEDCQKEALQLFMACSFEDENQQCQKELTESYDHYKQLMEEQVVLPTETQEELYSIHEDCQKEALQLFMTCNFEDENQLRRNKIFRSYDRYKQLMEDRVNLPTETQEELSSVHEDCQKEALQLLMACNFEDENQRCQIELTRLIKEDFRRKCEKNADLSEKHCRDLLKHLGVTLIPQFFMKVGGYKDYQTQLDTIIRKYKDTPDKGIKADHVLETFLENQKSLQGIIQQAENSFLDKETEKKVKESCDLYKELLGKKVKLPTDTQEELCSIHEGCLREALQHFMKSTIEDKNQQCRTLITTLINEEYEQKRKKNAELSEKRCTDILKQLSVRLIPEFFMKVGGYEDYQMQLGTIIQKYKDTPGKGIKADIVLEMFLENQKSLQGVIQQAEMGLLDKEKEKKVKESYALYKQLLGKRVKLPTDTQKLTSIHEECQEEALQHMACKFKDENWLCQKELTGLMNEEYERKCKENANLSEKHCTTLLHKLSAGLIPQAFMKSGGYEDYKMQLDSIIQKYKDTPGKGIKVPP